MKLKKLLCLLLAVLMVFSMAACGEDADQGGDKNNESGNKNPDKDPTVPTTTVPAEDDAVWVLVRESDMGSDRYDTYIYDAEGNLVAGEFYDGSKKYGDYKYTTIPTENGGKLVVQEYKHVKDTEFSKQKDFEFDAEGRLIHAATYDYMGDLNREFTFTYNEAGQLVEQLQTMNDQPEKKLTFVYDGDKLMESHYWDSTESYGHYIYSYDENGLPLKAEVHTNYMDEQQYTLEFVTEDGGDWWQLKATEDCHNVVGGRRLVYWEEDAEYGQPPYSRTLSIKTWGIFCTGWVPLVSFGCINPSNYFIGAAELHYEPLDVHLAKQAEGK